MRTCLLVLLLLTAGGLAAGQEPNPPPCPCQGACERLPVVCVATVGTKTKTHTCYSCRTKTVCLPYKPKCDGCGECCGRQREVRLLIKRFVKEEVQERVCEPVVAPLVCPAVKCPE